MKLSLLSVNQKKLPELELRAIAVRDRQYNSISPNFKNNSPIRRRLHVIMKKKPLLPGQVEIFCRYITRKGKRIYPKKGKFFHFYVDAKKAG